MILCNGEAPIDMPPRRGPTVVDTVGAGDTVNGGVLASLLESGKLTRAALHELGDDDVRAASTLGVRAAAVTAGCEGADPPSRADLPDGTT